MTGWQAVIFDMDGTLTDSEAWWDEVRRDLAASQGIAWPADATTRQMGMSTPEWARYLADQVGLAGTPGEVAGQVIASMAGRYRAGVPLLPGADRAVRTMAALGPVGLNSSSPRLLIDTVCAETGWQQLFTATVSTEEVARGKPAPDGYLRCAELLRVAPAGCVVVEDAANGIRSALAAGMTVVAVPPHFHPPGADLLARCAAVIDSLVELTPELLAGLAG